MDRGKKRDETIAGQVGSSSLEKFLPPCMYEEVRARERKRGGGRKRRTVARIVFSLLFPRLHRRLQPGLEVLCMAAKEGREEEADEEEEEEDRKEDGGWRGSFCRRQR